MMGMRNDTFVAIAVRLSQAAELFAEWAPVADAVATDRPGHVPPVIVDGVPRPTEAVMMARVESGVAEAITATLRHAIQAVLNAEAAIHAAHRAETAFSAAPAPEAQPCD